MKWRRKWCDVFLAPLTLLVRNLGWMVWHRRRWHKAQLSDWFLFIPFIWFLCLSLPKDQEVSSTNLTIYTTKLWRGYTMNNHLFLLSYAFLCRHRHVTYSIVPQRPEWVDVKQLDELSSYILRRCAQMMPRAPWQLTPCLTIHKEQLLCAFTYLCA